MSCVLGFVLFSYRGVLNCTYSNLLNNFFGYKNNNLNLFVIIIILSKSTDLDIFFQFTY